MQAGNIIQQVSVDLNDQEPGYEYERWPYLQLQSYLQEALDYVSSILKKEFVERVVVQVQPGDRWQDACDCEEIIRVLGISDAEGTTIYRRLRRVEDDETIVWMGRPGKNCSYGRSYLADGYSINATDKGSFKIFPPVPGWWQKPVHVTLECFKPPKVTGSSTDLPQAVVMPVKQWMLYRALSIDSENNETIFTLAKQHQEVFFKLVQDLRAAEELKVRRDGDTSQPAQRDSSR